MTVPSERTQAVLMARDLLTELAVAPNNADLGVLRTRARILLRHYPDRLHLHQSAAMAPEIWGESCPKGHE
jgi:hypothetical protein